MITGLKDDEVVRAICFRLAQPLRQVTGTHPLRFLSGVPLASPVGAATACADHERSTS